MTVLNRQTAGLSCEARPITAVAGREDAGALYKASDRVSWWEGACAIRADKSRAEARVSHTAGRTLGLAALPSHLTSEVSQLSIYDAAIVAVALEAGCDTILSEAMQHGQKFAALSIVNPYRRRTSRHNASRHLRPGETRPPKRDEGGGRSTSCALARPGAGGWLNVRCERLSILLSISFYRLGASVLTSSSPRGRRTQIITRYRYLAKDASPVHAGRP